jgi:hypothetical protein
MIAYRHDRLRPPYAWFGGKQWLGKIIYRYIPPHKRFVDLFTGSAAILCAKPPSPIPCLLISESSHRCEGGGVIHVLFR